MHHTALAGARSHPLHPVSGTVRTCSIPRRTSGFTSLVCRVTSFDNGFPAIVTGFTPLVEGVITIDQGFDSTANWFNAGHFRFLLDAGRLSVTACGLANTPRRVHLNARHESLITKGLTQRTARIRVTICSCYRIHPRASISGGGLPSSGLLTGIYRMNRMKSLNLINIEQKVILNILAIPVNLRVQQLSLPGIG